MGNKVKKIYMRRKVPRLPDAYQEVDYIQSSGTQYINTGFIPTNNTKVKLSMGGFSGTAASNCLFGARASRNADASIGRGLQFSVNATTTPRDYGGMFGRNYGPSSGMTSGMFAWADGEDYILEVSQSGFYENGVNKFTPQTVTFTSPVNLHIFSNNTNGTISEQTAYKLYYFEIYENLILVRNFIPCYRKSDNEIGLYDLVNGQFYTNAGSGTFTKGTDSSTLELKEFQVWPDEGGTLSGYRDFTTATKSALEGEGWGGQGGGSWSVSSSGLTTSRSTTDRSYLVSLPIQINTEAKSIKIYGLINRSVGSWYGNFQWGIRATNTCGSGRDDYPVGDWLIAQSANCNNNSGYMGYGAGSDVLGFTGPGQGNTSNLGYSGSDITVEAIIDLDGGTCSCSYKSGSTTIWSGSTTFDSATVKATLSGLSTNQYLSIFNRNGTGDYKYMKNFGYEIIY